MKKGGSLIDQDKRKKHSCKEVIAARVFVISELNYL